MPDILPGQPPTRGSNTPWGMVPQVPDPLSTANLAITGDIANLPSLTDLAGQVNQFNTGQAIAPYIANLPGYQGMVGQSSQNIGSLLRGEIPTDVMNLLNQQSAERGIASGLAGSPNASAAALRALGLTSLGLQQQGEGELTQAIGRTPVPKLFNVQDFLTSPSDVQAAQMAANIYAAAPDPQQQASELMRLFESFMSKMGGGAPTITLPGGGTRQPPIKDATYPPVTATGGAGESSPPITRSGGLPSWITSPGMTSYPSIGPSPMVGPAINPSTGAASGGFQGPAINPWTGSASGGYQGPAVNPWTGTASGGFQGPAINPWTGGASGGFQGPAIDPWTGFSTLAQQGNVYGSEQDAQAALDSWMNETLGAGNWEDWLYGGSSGSDQPPQTTYDPFTDSSVNMPDYGSSYDPYSLDNMSSGDMAAYLGLEDWYGGP